MYCAAHRANAYVRQSKYNLEKGVDQAGQSLAAMTVGPGLCPMDARMAFVNCQRACLPMCLSADVPACQCVCLPMCTACQCACQCALPAMCLSAHVPANVHCQCACQLTKRLLSFCMAQAVPLWPVTPEAPLSRLRSSPACPRRPVPPCGPSSLCWPGARGGLH